MMDEVPVIGLDELEAHLQCLAEDPEIPADGVLFDKVELQLTGKF